MLHRPYTNVRHAATLVLACALLGGCSGDSLLTKVGDILAGRGVVKTSLERISVLARQDANGNSATALDVVLVYDDKVLALLPKDAAAWFASRDELQTNLQRHLDVASVEVPPAYLLDAVPLPDRYPTALRVAVYANYLSKKGRKPLDLTSFKSPLLTLESKTITITEQSKNDSP